MKNYHIVEEASGAILETTESLGEALLDIDNYPSSGKYLVVDEDSNVLYDTKPGVTYKI